MTIRPLLATVAVFLMAPVTSFAAIQCSYICNGVNCDQRCSDGIVPTTCRGAGYCFEATQGSDASASVTQDESAPVCSEENPEAEQTETAES